MAATTYTTLKHPPNSCISETINILNLCFFFKEEHKVLNNTKVFLYNFNICTPLNISTINFDQSFKKDPYTEKIWNYY